MDQRVKVALACLGKVEPWQNLQRSLKISAMGAMRGARRRLQVATVVAMLCMLGTAVLASPAMAGGVDTDTGDFAAGVYNVTPYPMTLVAAATPETGACSSSCWLQRPASTIAPGEAMVYRLAPNFIGGGGITFSDEFGYDGWMTYRVDVLGGPPEYVTISLSQRFSNGVFGNNIPALRQFITSAPPAASYDPGPNPDALPAPLTTSPQLTYQPFAPQPFDLTYTLTGNHTVDASSNLGQALADVLNAICNGDKSNTCSFAQTGPLTWGIGTPVNTGIGFNCTSKTPTGGSSGRRAASSSGVGDEPKPPPQPPENDPNYFLIDYEDSQSASLTVGGSVSVGTKFNLFDSISGSISVKLEAEHEWQQVQSYTRETKVYIPDNSAAHVWVAPVVGKVTGTLTLTTGPATFTITNFSETRDGVAKDDLTPAFDVITNTRPMTPTEKSKLCPSGTMKGLGNVPSGRSAPSRLVAGRGVSKVLLGQSQTQVSRTLGTPSSKLFTMRRCWGLQTGCDAMPAAGGIWNYRGLSVRYSANRHVDGVVYRGHRRTAGGIGVGSGLTAFEAMYDNESCTPLLRHNRYARQVFCTLSGHDNGVPVQTVFRFGRTRHHIYDCDKVTIALVDPSLQGAT
jgi:hypothetical protein